MTSSALERAQAYTTDEPAKFLGLWTIKPKPHAYAQGRTIPESRANWFSQILFSWVTPILLVGYSRPLELDDIWRLLPCYEAEHLATTLERNFYNRVPPSERPVHLQNKTAMTATASFDQQTLGEEAEEKSNLDAVNKDFASPPVEPSAALPTVSNTKVTDEKTGKTTEGGKKYDRSLLMALNRTVFWRSVILSYSRLGVQTIRRLSMPTILRPNRFWGAAPIGLIAVSFQAFAPLVSRALLEFIQDSYASSHPTPGAAPVVPRGIGYGIGLAFVIWAMQQLSSLILAQYMQRSLATGCISKDFLCTRRCAG